MIQRIYHSIHKRRRKAGAGHIMDQHAFGRARCESLKTRAHRQGARRAAGDDQNTIDPADVIRVQDKCDV